MSRSGEELLEQLTDKTAPIKLKWDLTKEEIGLLTDVTCAKVREGYAKIAASKANPTFENVIKAMVEIDTYQYAVSNVCTFPQHTHPDKDIRDASTEAEKKFDDLNVECSMNHEVYLAVAAFAEASLSTLEGESKRLVERMMRDYKRDGLHLEEDKRNKVKALKEEMNKLGTDFAKNLGEENAKFDFQEAELEGLPADFMEARKKEGAEGTFTLSLKYPDYIPLMKYCKVAATRQKMEKEFNSRCKGQNAPILEKLCALRQEQADVLGYKVHAEYVLETRMAKSPEKVLPFLSDLAEKLTPLQQKEVAVCLEIKKEEEGDAFDGKLNNWDIPYYKNKVEERDYNVNHQDIKQYFPIEVVTAGLLEIYQELLGLKFTLVADAEVWHEDVTLYEVRDSGGEGALVGYFYMDMYPRDGKYGHAACFGLQPSCELSDGSRQLPIAAAVCNFTKPEEGRPSLLMHNEVETFFHEFGHVMHQLCSKAQYVHFAGTAVERDFVEAPSQMLENWCWEAEALARMSGHVDDHSKKLPEELCTTLLNSRLANCGINNKRQLLLGSFDQYIHTQRTVDTSAELGRLTKEITGLEKTPGTNMAASFGHLAGGYDAQYYGYMWSEVYSADMFESRFKKEGIFSKKAGMDYRNCILGPGGSKDAIDLLKDFLGREPNSEAFLKSKGL